jgi:hypothetical protein
MVANPHATLGTLVTLTRIARGASIRLLDGLSLGGDTTR